MAMNDKYNKIVNTLFGGDMGREAKVQNDAIAALALRQEAIIGALSATAQKKIEAALVDSKVDEKLAMAKSVYDKKREILNNGNTK